ncbi:hypothetical protein llap_7593 [Limosa lapponica baueri]|uniref:Uncharacterized protein n=1 Tax=Limosa lapponica baueri TaxID=1758121 RepID=A0A2I0U7W8_LIMLA|nr:hypothetical protein llap_7593 [Limosa lapponica baueri]
MAGAVASQRKFAEQLMEIEIAAKFPLPRDPPAPLDAVRHYPLPSASILVSKRRQAYESSKHLPDEEVSAGKEAAAALSKLHLLQKFCNSGENVRDVESYLSPKSRQNPKSADCRYYALTTGLISNHTG